MKCWAATKSYCIWSLPGWMYCWLLVVGLASCAQQDLNFASLATIGVQIFGSKWTRQHRRLHVVLTAAINSFNAKTRDNAAIFDTWNDCLQVIACEFDIWNQDNLFFYQNSNPESTCSIHVQYANDRTCSQWGKLFPIMVNKKKVNMHSMHGVVLSFLQW